MEDFRRFAKTDNQEIEVDRLLHAAHGFQHCGSSDSGVEWDVESWAPTLHAPITMTQTTADGSGRPAKWAARLSRTSWPMALRVSIVPLA